MRQPKNSKKGLGDKNFQPTLRPETTLFQRYPDKTQKCPKMIRDYNITMYYVMGECIQDRMMYKGYDIDRGKSQKFS